MFATKNFEDHEYLLKVFFNKTFGVVGISESRIINDSILYNILTNTTTLLNLTLLNLIQVEPTLLYINNKLINNKSCKLRLDLHICKSNELESTVIEIINNESH